MRRSEYIGHPELVQLNDGYSVLDLKRFVQAYGAKAVVSNLPRKKPIRRQVAQLGPSTSLIASHRTKRSPLPATRTVNIYQGEGLGQLDLNDLLERAPIMVPINALGYNHFVVFRGIMGNRVRC